MHRNLVFNRPHLVEGAYAVLALATVYVVSAVAHVNRTGISFAVLFAGAAVFSVAARLVHVRAARRYYERKDHLAALSTYAACDVEFTKSFAEAPDVFDQKAEKMFNVDMAQLRATDPTKARDLRRQAKTAYYQEVYGLKPNKP